MFSIMLIVYPFQPHGKLLNKCHSEIKIILKISWYCYKSSLLDARTLVPRGESPDFPEGRGGFFIVHQVTAVMGHVRGYGRSCSDSLRALALGSHGNLSSPSSSTPLQVPPLSRPELTSRDLRRIKLWLNSPRNVTPSVIRRVIARPNTSTCNPCAMGCDTRFWPEMKSFVAEGWLEGCWSESRSDEGK